MPYARMNQPTVWRAGTSAEPLSGLFHPAPGYNHRASHRITDHSHASSHGITYQMFEILLGLDPGQIAHGGNVDGR